MAFPSIFRETNMSDKPNYPKPLDEPEPRRIRDTTRNLVQAVLLDVWPRNAAIVDFGIDTQEHYEALYYPLRHGDITPGQVDAALGKGMVLTELVNAAPHNPHKGIVFHTGWDGLSLEAQHHQHDGKSAGQPSLSEIANSRTATTQALENGNERDKETGKSL
jgi:hypothetical protein